MSEDNGTPRVLTLDAARRPSRKGNDFITVRHTQELVVEECKKVHEFYLQQIPNYVAKMTQDALLHYGLIKVEEPEPDIVPTPDAPLPVEPAR
jgi:hypothetical protein